MAVNLASSGGNEPAIDSIYRHDLRPFLLTRAPGAGTRATAALTAERRIEYRSRPKFGLRAFGRTS
jgi:hypothetical protein